MNTRSNTDEEDRSLDDATANGGDGCDDPSSLSANLSAVWDALKTGLTRTSHQADSECGSTTRGDSPDSDGQKIPGGSSSQPQEVRQEVASPAAASEDHSRNPEIPEEGSETIQLSPGRLSGLDVLARTSFLLRLGSMIRSTASNLEMHRMLAIGEGLRASCDIEIQDNYARSQDTHIPFTIVLSPRILAGDTDWKDLPKRKTPVGIEALNEGNLRKSLDFLTELVEEAVAELEEELRTE